MCELVNVNLGDKFMRKSFLSGILAKVVLAIGTFITTCIDSFSISVLKPAEIVATELYAQGVVLAKTVYSFTSKVSPVVRSACNGFISLVRSLVATSEPCTA